MKKILPILLILASLNAASNAELNYLQEEQVRYLMNQAQFLAKQGITQEDIIKIFEQSLTDQELGATKPKKNDLRLIESILCISLGAAVTYLIMDYKLREERARNPVYIVQQVFQPVAQESSFDLGKELSNFADFCGEKIQAAGSRISNFVQNIGK